MRCLYCGKRLPLLKKLTGGGEFCSEAHRQSYHEEYNRLALSRLLQAQTRPEEHLPKNLRNEPAAEAAPQKALWVDPKYMAGPVRQTVTAKNSTTGPVLAQPGVWKSGEPDLPPSAAVLELPVLAEAGLVPVVRLLSAQSRPESFSIAPGVWQTPAVGCTLPRQTLEIDSRRRPADAGPVDLRTDHVPPESDNLRGPEPGMPMYRPAPAFAEMLEPVWSAGLAFDPAGAIAPAEPAAEAPVEEQAAIAEPEPAIAATPEEVTPAPPDSAPPPVVPEPEPEPEPEPAVPMSETAEPEPAPEPVVEVAVHLELPEPAGPAPSIVPWLPIDVKPAPMTNKPRLMQSFQAVSMIRIKPQIPAFDVLPLRPRMTLSRKPAASGTVVRNLGPGTNGVGPAGAPAGVATRKPPEKADSGDSHAETASMDLPVPSFATQGTPGISGRLARWLNKSHRPGNG